MIRNETLKEYLNKLVGLKLVYARKKSSHPITEIVFSKNAGLYDGHPRGNCTLRCSCPILLIRKADNMCVGRFYENSTAEDVDRGFAAGVGSEALKVSLGDGNVLILDLGEYTLQICTVRNGSESWRCTCGEGDGVSLVVTDRRISFV